MHLRLLFPSPRCRLMPESAWVHCSGPCQWIQVPEIAIELESPPVRFHNVDDTEKVEGVQIKQPRRTLDQLQTAAILLVERIAFSSPARD
jgi:hypothetical protein